MPTPGDRVDAAFQDQFVVMFKVFHERYAGCFNDALRRNAAVADFRQQVTALLRARDEARTVLESIEE